MARRFFESKQSVKQLKKEQRTEDALDIVVLMETPGEFEISVNGKEYKYKANAEQICKFFRMLRKAGPGKALVFLKKETSLIVDKDEEENILDFSVFSGREDMDVKEYKGTPVLVCTQSEEEIFGEEFKSLKAVITQKDFKIIANNYNQLLDVAAERSIPGAPIKDFIEENLVMGFAIIASKGTNIKSFRGLIVELPQKVEKINAATIDGFLVEVYYGYMFM